MNGLFRVTPAQAFIFSVILVEKYLEVEFQFPCHAVESFLQMVNRAMLLFAMHWYVSYNIVFHDLLFELNNFGCHAMNKYLSLLDFYISAYLFLISLH